MNKNKIVLIVVLALVALMFLLAFLRDGTVQYSDEPRPCDETEDSTWSDVKLLYSGEPRPCDKTEDTTWGDLKKLWG